MLLVMPYFASMPMSLSILFDVGGEAIAVGGQVRDAVRLQLDVARWRRHFHSDERRRDWRAAARNYSAASRGVIDSSECSLIRRSHAAR
jgi:hypothetical protein